MKRDDVLRYWNLAWTEGLWHAKWSAALTGLTAEQAATQPERGKHSIWQIANHMIFWREYVMDRQRTGNKLSSDEIEARNWAGPTAVSEEAWGLTQARFEQSHKDFAAFIADESVPIEEFEFEPHHDSYHVGQIMQLRAGFGLKPIE